MKKNIILHGILFLILFGFVLMIQSFFFKGTVVKGKNKAAEDDNWTRVKAYVINQSPLFANVDSKQIKSTTDNIYMSDELNLMMPAYKIRDIFDCSVRKYGDDYFLIEKGEKQIKVFMDGEEYDVDGTIYSEKNCLEFVNDTPYISSKLLSDALDYSYNYDEKSNNIYMISNDDVSVLPLSYSYEDAKRVPVAMNQGNLGTCWAFASLTALESALLPEESYNFSIDNMSICNSFNLTQDEGGNYNMSIAYLLSWQGPVLEKDDPYGDGIGNFDALSVKHVQDVQIVEAKDYEMIKKMVFKYGGVQSSFYASDAIDYGGKTKYYNQQNYSYCYKGDEKANHDIVIIGWDDNYPKENFNIDVEGDGAFLCRNSWGADFGDNGDFYISYYDSNIGVTNVVYTRIDDVYNYDNIYQSDMCGYIGGLGYEEDRAYFANVYTANDYEKIKAVGFYATKKNTEYSIYVVKDFEDTNSLTSRNDPVLSGSFVNEGFYTVDLENEIEVEKNEKFAIIVRVKSPGQTRPVAVEFPYDKATENVDVSDGEGYVSYQGINWENTEEKYNCNICLKVYTDKSK
ncbi:Cysteine protease, C1A family [Lachnospiraceae bacterium RM5]|nr:Cysteine protease, C1A family [Lachnospiraceae bacterium RM5]